MTEVQPSSVAFAFLPACSPSVRTHWSLDSLRNLLWHLAQTACGGNLTVVAKKDYVPFPLGVIAAANDVPGLRVVLTASEDPLVISDLVLATQKATSSTLIYLPLAAALLRVATTQFLVSSHASGTHDCSFFSSLPRELTPIVYERSVAVRAQREFVTASTNGSSLQSWISLIVKHSTSANGGRGLNLVDARRLFPDAAEIPSAVEMSTATGVARFDDICRAANAWYEPGSVPRVHSDEAGCFLSAWRQRADFDDHATWPRVPAARVGTPNRRRILIVSEPVAFSGAEESLCSAVSQLSASSKYEFHALLGMDGTFADRLRELGVHTRVARQRLGVPTLQAHRYLAECFGDLMPDVVHYNAFSGIPAVVMTKLFGARCLFHLRTRSINRELENILRQADHVIAVSHRTKEMAIVAGAPPSRVSVIYDPIDTIHFSPPTPLERCAAKKALGLDPHVPTILMVARYVRWKRHDLLLRAISRLPVSCVVQCVLVGESDGDLAYEAELVRTIETHPALRRTIRIPFHDDIRSIERAADLCVLCSEDEPLGIFPLQAMSMGLPVIVGERSGVAEIVGNDEAAGLLCSAGDEVHLANQMLRFIMNPDLRERVSVESRRRCIERCGDAPRVALESIYDQL